MATSKKVEESGMIVLDKIKMEKVKVRIKGLTDVITHAWNYKAKWEMLIKQMYGSGNKLLGKKLSRCPILDFAEGLYWISNRPEILNYKLPTDLNGNTSGYENLVKTLREDESLILDEVEKGIFGFPAGGLKAAMVGACRLKDNLQMVTTKMLFHVDGYSSVDDMENYEYIIFENEDGTPCKPFPREDMVTIGKNLPDIRYRPAFTNWYANVIISYNAEKFDRTTATNLLDAAGNGGIGEFRPSAKKTCSGNYGRFEVIGEPRKA